MTSRTPAAWLSGRHLVRALLLVLRTLGLPLALTLPAASLVAQDPPFSSRTQPLPLHVTPSGEGIPLQTGQYHVALDYAEGFGRRQGRWGDVEDARGTDGYAMTRRHIGLRFGGAVSDRLSLHTRITVESAEWIKPGAGTVVRPWRESLVFTYAWGARLQLVRPSHRSSINLLSDIHNARGYGHVSDALTSRGRGFTWRATSVSLGAYFGYRMGDHIELHTTHVVASRYRRDPGAPLTPTLTAAFGWTWTGRTVFVGPRYAFPYVSGYGTRMLHVVSLAVGVRGEIAGRR